MFQKSSLLSPMAVAYHFVSLCLISAALLAQDTPIELSSPVTSDPPAKVTSNLVTNNPFVPKNNGTLNNTKKKPTVPQTITNKQQVLQKYLLFKSIAIINKKKYFSIFNKRTNKSFWISEGETVENFRVTNYNQINNTITITDGINAEVIPIITANETPLNVVSAVAQPKKQDTITPPIPGATANQNKDKPKTPPRRRVIPVKR